MNSKPIASICIPAFNRPVRLKRSLESISVKYPKDIEIVICEDNSSKRIAIREVVKEYQKTSPNVVRYYENSENLGYDKNLKELIRLASGEYIIYLADDDAFEKNGLDVMIAFLKEHPELGYVLRSYTFIDSKKNSVRFRYYNKTKFFNAGKESYIEMFRKSVFISGFTVKRKLVVPHMVDDFDGSLLFQLYLFSEVVLFHPSAYLDIPLTIGFEGSEYNFGNAEAEKKYFDPGSITLQNSINFLAWFPKLTGYIDKKYGISSSPMILKDMSKYFYPSLAIQRDKGILPFIAYIRKLNELGFNISVYYYLYIVGLILFGKRNCDNGIRILKNIIGRTPRL